MFAMFITDIDISACSLVCSKWHQLTEDNLLWRRIFFLKIGKIPV